MKLIVSFLLVVLFIGSSLAQDKYVTGMQSTLAKMEGCKTPNDYLKVANGFERIAAAEKDKWLPYYWGALNCVLACYSDSSNTTKDLYLDRADKYINKADSLEPNNSEIFTLKGMIANNCFTKAMQADTRNPRPEYLIGVGLYYTPAQFGGGPQAAKPVLEKSLAKFDLFVPKDELMPHWGKEQVEQYLKMISESK
jgi:hypothetical protein